MCDAGGRGSADSGTVCHCGPWELFNWKLVHYLWVDNTVILSIHLYWFPPPWVRVLDSSISALCGQGSAHFCFLGVWIVSREKGGGGYTQRGHSVLLKQRQQQRGEVEGSTQRGHSVLLKQRQQQRGGGGGGVYSERSLCATKTTTTTKVGGGGLLREVTLCY